MCAPARFMFASLALLSLCGCQERDPLEARIEAQSPIELQMWITGAAGRLSDEQVADLREALQELRFQIMTEGKASGSEAIEAALCEEVDGRTVRRVLVDGFTHEVERIKFERNGLLASKRVNENLRTRPGDLESQACIDRVNERVRERLSEGIKAESRAEAILARYGAPKQ